LKPFLFYIKVTYRWLKLKISDRVISLGKHWAVNILHIGFLVCNAVLPFATLAAFLLIIYDFGFHPFFSSQPQLYRYLLIVLSVFKILFVVRFVSGFLEIKKWRAHLYSLVLVALTFYLFQLAANVRALQGSETNEYLLKKLLLYALISFLFVTEASGLLKYLYRRRQNAAFLFIVSFALLISCGALLLKLPTATVKGISFVDALFTSASAVCVTGLTVLDTAADFTFVGKFIILLLIQVGGLGIMTFTGLLAFLATDSVSFSSQMALKSMVSSNRMSNVITIVGRIILVTFFFESIGAFLLYASIDPELFERRVELIFFSVFHSVSAFCNAGFSTLPQGLNTPPFKFNYPLHLIIALLIVLGGMGFPITFNIFSYIRGRAYFIRSRLFGTPMEGHRTRIVEVNSKIALWTTLILLISGTILYFAFELNASLKEHETFVGKIVTSIFGSVTPRTAGFNTVNMQALSLPTIMIYLLFMWIGASPSSTGGGIKTTTIAIAFLNLRAMVTGNNRMEVFRTQISEASINRAFAVILISLLVIGLSVLLVSVTDKQFKLIEISFEAFSAFATVGLSLGITPQLSDPGKIIFIVTMFIGRVGSLTLLMAFAAQAKRQLHQYPVEEILY
jgi:potassium uptake TrkH family protein